MNKVIKPSKDDLRDRTVVLLSDAAERVAGMVQSLVCPVMCTLSHSLTPSLAQVVNADEFDSSHISESVRMTVNVPVLAAVD